jgi:hypothetical protein
MLIALTSLAFEIAAERARCLILKTEHELSVVGDASDKIGVAYFLIGRWEPSSDLSFFTTSRSTPHPLRVLAGLSPRQKKLVQAIREIQTAYDELLRECQTLLHDAFAVRSSETKLREDLRVRSNHLMGQSIERSLHSFTVAAADETVADKEWLEALVMIVADKPAESWTDEDVTKFEINLSDISRRFKNLEALQKEVVAKGAGFDARRITVTRPDGQEIHQMVGIDRDRQDQVDHLVNDFLAKLGNNSQIRQAALVRLMEAILGEVSQENVAQIRGKHKNRESGEETSHA